MTQVEVGGRKFQLGYSTNVHPGRDLIEVTAGLEQHAARVRERVSPGDRLGIGLWLSARTAEALDRDARALANFSRFLDRHGLYVFTLNAFPYGDFHAGRVKEEVFRPSWADPRRVEYTSRAARVLAALLPDGVAGSVSTLAGGARADGDDRDTRTRIAANLQALDRELASIEERTGKRIVLALEPEPLTTIETAGDAISFFSEHLAGTTHLGLCYDVCHQAVLFEEVPSALSSLAASGIAIAKVHLSSAIEVKYPGGSLAARRALEILAKDRYLHQTYARFADGQVESVADLPDAVPTPPPRWQKADSWRTHYHVPIFAASLGPLGTTKRSLEDALRFLATAPRETSPHLEIETYTWEALPAEHRERLAPDLASGIALEFEWVREQFSKLA
ncbi:MAG: metabolite traffic protein EboE [Planctomycetes bacterium]|nr:metabolite traffic protein EboE [Planctomycetota bacterium]